MFNIDWLIFEKINSLAGQFAWLDTFSIFLAEKLIYFLFFFVFCYFFFLWQREKRRARQFCLSLIFILGLTIIVNLFFNLFYFRPRPYLVYSAVKKLTHFSGVLKSSFPSSHTSLVFALSFAILLTDKKLGWFFLVLAFLIGLGRIFIGVHWPSDILASIFITFIFSYLCRRFILDKNF